MDRRVFLTPHAPVHSAVNGHLLGMATAPTFSHPLPMLHMTSDDAPPCPKPIFPFASVRCSNNVRHPCMFFVVLKREELEIKDQALYLYFRLP